MINVRHFTCRNVMVDQCMTFWHGMALLQIRLCCSVQCCQSNTGSLLTEEHRLSRIMIPHCPISSQSSDKSVRIDFIADMWSVRPHAHGHTRGIQRTFLTFFTREAQVLPTATHRHEWLCTTVRGNTPVLASTCVKRKSVFRKYVCMVYASLHE